ncbi:MAG TPA: chemotaxis protein CheA [Paracoccaceae bacterium]|nr:chemotaxis protein CheA [Paracoccaceae bacterium]
MDDIRATFFQECEELIETLGDGLRVMDRPDHEMETVHAVFRAVHSVKGGAAAFGLSDLVAFAHRFETVLDHIRSGRLAPGTTVMPVLHRAGDCLADLVAAARRGGSVPPDRITALMDDLDTLLGGPAAVAEAEETFDYQPITLDLIDLSAPAPAGWSIDFRPLPALFGTGNDPVALFLALGRLGPLEVTALTDAVPPLSVLDPESSCLSWRLILRSEATEAEVRAVFEFVEDVCDLTITPLDETPAPSLPVDPDPAPVLRLVAQTPAPEVTVLPHPAPDAPGRAAAPMPAADSGGAPPATIRVNLDRVDRLINLIGELVIKEAMLAQVIGKAGLEKDSDVATGLDGIRQLAGEIQESVMSIRAQPLKPVFQRMHRILREAADSTGKQVRLVTLGDQTEVDKTVIERLVDPLTHMLRNSVDHGLESADRRRAAGKPVEGTITLSAAHRSGRVVIDVSDDGGGIDRPRVRRVAEERGLIPPGASLTAAEIDALLFLPGFSSKAEVSALSGRGVGLDVVRREIQALGGRVMISSVEGEGTTFSIALPLTLAVLEGMVVDIGGQTMVIPITAIQETLRPQDTAIHPIGLTGRVVSNRGDLIPVIDVAAVLGLGAGQIDGDQGVLIVVETDTHRRAALWVDGIHDQRQVVIKSLEENYGRVAGVSAATILGDGRIALIVDPEEIVLSPNPDAGGQRPVLAAAG